MTLVSPEHSDLLEWGTSVDETEDACDDDSDGDDDSSRLYPFQVSKTQEQEEGVASRPGFTVRVLL